MAAHDNGWRVAKLDELGVVGRGKSKHRPRDDARLFGGPYPFIQTGDVKKANLRLTDYGQTYSEFGLSQSKLWEPGTLCITIAANIADTAILGIRACFPDSVVGFMADPAKTDVRFIKYAIDTMKLHMENVSHGTTQDNLSLDKLLRFDFRVPALPLQRRVADILSAYDDLIENNTRRIRILEEMARTLYRDWFDAHTSKGRGALPTGWRWGHLGDAVTLQRGYDLPQRERRAGTIPIVSSSGVTGFHDEARVTAPGIVTGRYGTLGEVYFVDRAFWPLNTTLFVKDFKRNSPIWVLHLLRSLDFAAKNAAGAVPGVNRNALHLLPVILPSEEAQIRFEAFAGPLHEQARKLDAKNTCLASQRDLLLPKLMSGALAPPA